MASSSSARRLDSAWSCLLRFDWVMVRGAGDGWGTFVVTAIRFGWAVLDDFVCVLPSEREFDRPYPRDYAFTHPKWFSIYWPCLYVGVAGSAQTKSTRLSSTLRAHKGGKH